MAFFPAVLRFDPRVYWEQGLPAPVELPSAGPPPAQAPWWVLRTDQARDGFAPPPPPQPPRPIPRNNRVVSAFESGRADLETLRRVSTFTISQSGKDWTAALECLRAAGAARDPATGQPAGADRILFNAAMAACARAGRQTQAIELFDTMIASGIAPDAHSYGSAISACARTGDLEQAFGLWRHLLGHGPARQVHPDISTYGAMVSACAAARQGRAALQVFQHLLEHGPRRGLRPNALVYNTVIWACGREGREEDAWSVFQRMERQTGPGAPRPDSVTFIIAHAACGPDRRRLLLEKAIAAGAFTPLAGLDRASNTVDLRQRAVLTQYKSATRERSINANLGATIFEHLLAAGAIDPATRFFLGNHDHQALKEQIEKCMRDAGWTPGRPADSLETRRWRRGGLLAGTSPSGGLNADAAEFVPAGAPGRGVRADNTGFV